MPESAQKAARSMSYEPKIGEHVVAYCADGEWYPAKVLKVSPLTVAWDEGGTDVVEQVRPLPERLDVEVGPGGRIVIPAVYRKAMQAKEGDRLMASVVDGELRLKTPMVGVRLAQKMVRETIRGDVSLVDDLLEERRREFAREMEDG